MKLKRLAKRHSRLKSASIKSILTIGLLLIAGAIIISIYSIFTLFKDSQRKEETSITYNHFLGAQETIRSNQIFQDRSDESAAIPLNNNMYGPYQVIRVVDGDTIVVSIDCLEVKIRLIGIDAPESVNPDETKNTPFGKVSSDYLSGLLNSNTEVYLEYDTELKDKYERTLAYVYLSNGTMLNKILVQLGYAEEMSVQPNTKYQNEFHDLQEEAKLARIGIWSK